MNIELPKVYADSYQLTIKLFTRTKAFPKQFRPTLARRLEDCSLDLTEATRKMLFCCRQDLGIKRKHLILAVDSVDSLKFLMQLSSDLCLLSAGGYGEINERVQEIGRQLGGLAKFLEIKE